MERTIERRALKTPDEFFKAVQALFDQLSKNFKPILVGLVIAVIVGGVAAYFSSSREKKGDQAKSALFLANKALETELKSLAKAMAPRPEVGEGNAAKAAPKAQKDGAKDPAETVSAESIAFKQFDVDAKLPESVRKFDEVAKQYKGTWAAFEASLFLGGLYHEHGEAAKALPWYERALAQAPNAFEKAVALQSMGYAHEAVGKHADALKAYEEALKLGGDTLKGDLLLSMARCYEAMRDLTKARSTYDQIIAQMPNTGFSESAESFKGLLE